MTGIAIRSSVTPSPVVSHVAFSPAPAATSTTKRVLDLIAASVLLVVFAPVMAVIAVVVRATSEGPVFFRQRRLGLCGRPFTMLKFRTMQVNASDEPHRSYVAGMITKHDGSLSNGGAYKLVNDARVTAIGQVLRRFSFDELPQLFNVLRGEMSLVGPRPALEYEVEKYESWQFARLHVRPGLTGLWQVSGRNRLSYVEMCRLDVEYVRSWSLAGDLAIMAKTPFVMLFNSGSAA